MDKKYQTAPCGLDCFNCSWFEENVTDEFKRSEATRLGIPPDEVGCRGCRGEQGKCYWAQGDCATWACVEKKGVTYCFECGEFPCGLLAPSAKGVSYPHNMKVYNLCRKMCIRDRYLIEPENGMSGEVEFKDVNFKYPDAEDYALENLNFKAKNGETVAFIGSTGCGKSTVVNLIPRFYDVTSGEVLVDGVNVKDYTQSALRNKIGYVSQKAILFQGSVSSNVAFGSNGANDVSEEMVVSAVATAQSTDFVESMENAYESYIAPGGTNLSGGQKQRLSIARAIAREPEILIFDDSFSALDYKTDRRLRSDLKKRAKGATVLIVAQRIGTIKDADKIIVLENGKIAGMGVHRELMKTCEIYKEIAYSQLSKEELENE